MKRNDWIILASTLIYSFLFYHQRAGLNFLLFTMVLIGGLYIIDKKAASDRRWIITAAIALLTGATVFINGTMISVIANVIALSFLASQTFSKGSSLFLAFLYSAYSYSTSFVFVILDLFDKKNNPSNDVKPNKGLSNGIRFIIGFVILVIVIMFFALYRKANPLFKDFTDRINLDFISAEWMFFTLLGFLLLYGFFHQRNSPSIHAKDISTPNHLDRDSVMGKLSRFLGFEIGANAELMVGAILVGLLNFMLLVLNLLDIVLLANGTSLPDGVSYSSYVHQGVGSLIFSIVLVIIIIGYTFRGQLNFTENNKVLRFLVFFWLAQNLIMLLMTAYRNQIYISEYSLTYRRIGVFVWLFLTGVGLVTTWLKISGKRNNWYIFRINGWSFFLVLSFLSLWNWDGIISRYNSRHSDAVDYAYLLNLNHAALPVLLEAVTSPDAANDSLVEKGVYYNDMLLQDVKSETMRKVFLFLEAQEKSDIRSYCIGKAGTVDRINEILAQRAGYKISLDNIIITQPKVLSHFFQAGELYLEHIDLTDLSFLTSYQLLHTLTLKDAGINDLSSLPQLKSLISLDLTANSIIKGKWLANMSGLVELNLSQNNLSDISCLSTLKHLKKLDISINPVRDFTPLKSLIQLESLNISQMENPCYKTLPAMPNLKELILRNSRLDQSIDSLRPFLLSLQNLESLDLEGNGLDSYDYIMALAENPDRGGIFDNEENTKVLFPNLKKLSLSENNLSFIQKISLFPMLEELDLSYNSGIMGFEPLLAMKHLRKLDLTSCSIIDIDTLYTLNELEWLSIAGTHSVQVNSLNKFKHLKFLDMSQCSFYTWSVFKMPELLELNLSNSMISDLSLLASLNKLEILDLRGNEIDNYAPLASIKSLKVLYLSESSPAEIRKLKIMLPGVMIFSDSYHNSNFFGRNDYSETE